MEREMEILSNAGCSLFKSVELCYRYQFGFLAAIWYGASAHVAHLHQNQASL
jgi:hypothetical protein